MVFESFEQQDFCAIKLETVLFYIHRRAALMEFSTEDGAPIPMEGGYVVAFKFVRVDGVKRHLQEYLSIDWYFPVLVYITAAALLM